MAAADEVQINEHTLCRAAIHAFDANDLPMIQEILRFVHNVFDDLDARYKEDEGDRALSITLSDKNEGYIVLGYCRQHPPATIYEQVAHLYRAMRSLRSPLGRDDDDGEMAAVFERLAGQPDVGLLVPSDAFTYFRSATIVALAAKHRLPAICAFRRFADEGGLVAYGVDAFEQMRATASYVDRILKGAKPGDLPVQMPTKYSLIINLKTAKALGLNVPPGLIAAADDVIE